MNIDIPYGKDKKVPLKVPEKTCVEIIYPNDVETKDEKETILNAIKNPLGKMTMGEYLKGGENVLVIVNDATRPTPSAKILGCFFDLVKEKPVRYISAVGSHRIPTEEEHKVMFGAHYDEIKNKILLHECKKDEDMVFFGKTKAGTEIFLNKAIAEADKIIIINSVEPHYFAGYTGGRKSIFPGLASYLSISQNHKLAMDEKAVTFALKGNPVHDDMEEIISKVGKEIYSVQVVLDKHHKVHAAFVGNYRLTFDAAVKKAHDLFAVKIKEKADIVITVAPYPTDIDLYQAQKALDNGKNAVKKNGILILVAECRDKIGNETFYNLLCTSDKPGNVMAEIRKGYKLGYHKAAKMAEIMIECQICAVTSLPQGVLDKIFIKSFTGVQEAFDEAMKIKGNDASVIILMDGNLTVPTVN